MIQIDPTARQILLIGAIASVSSAITTAVLIYGPNASVSGDVLAQAQLHSDWAYLYKRWILFFHPQFAFVAAVASGFVLFRRSPALVVFGLFYLLIWVLTEITQQAYVIDGLNQIWRPAYLGATDPAAREMYATLLTGFQGISDSQYFLLLFGFGVGSVLMGLAFFAESSSLARGIGALQLAIGVLSLTAFCGYYLGASFLVSSTSWIYEHLYGVAQTGVRIALGFWLWRHWRQGAYE